jgi:RNA polymerase primary sigma factor
MNKNIIINTDELQYYLKDLRRIPVITHEREDEIFKQLQNKSLTPAEINNLKLELTTGNLRFVITVAKQYQGQGLDLLDLISEGNFGILKAIDRYNLSSGVKFISYAVWWIRQSIMSALNDYSRTIRIPSNLAQGFYKNKKEISPDNNDEIIISLPFCCNLYDEINEEGDMLIDIIPDPNENNPEFQLNSKEEIKGKVDLVLRVLDEREKIIIEKYFGLNGIESNLEDLGIEFNCTKERIRQLKDKSLKKLRNESFNLLNLLNK